MIEPGPRRGGVEQGEDLDLAPGLLEQAGHLEGDEAAE